MARPRLHPPWIPGLWTLLAFILLISSVVVFYYALSRGTRFERVPEKTEGER